MKYLVVFIMFCLLCVNCNYSENNVDDAYVREIDVIANLSKNRKVNLSTIASGIEYTVLETDKKCLVTSEMSIYCTEEYVVTIGGHQSYAGCYVFERKTGNFVRQISNYGRGPGEYTETIDLFWDGDKEQVCLWGNNQYIFYNIDGTLAHQTNKFNHWMFRFVAYDDFYVGYVNNDFGDKTVRIAFYDKTGALIDSIPEHRTWERTKTYYTRGNFGWLYVFDDNLYFKDLFCDTLYHIKDFVLHPRYVFNTDGRTVPYEKQEGGRYDPFAAMRGDEYDRYERYVNILKILEDNRYLYFNVEYRKELYPAIYDKIESQLMVLPPVSIPPPSRYWRLPLHGFENDLDGGLPFWPQQMISDKEMMCVYTAEELLELDVSRITDEKLKNILNSINEESNPVIVIVTLKD